MPVFVDAPSHIGHPQYSRGLTVDEVIRFLKEHHADLWRQLYTKHYEVDSHYSSQVVAAALGWALIQAEESRLATAGARSQSAEIVAASAAILGEYDYPMYFVGRNLLRGLLLTNPPPDQTWGDLMMPFPALIFMLPANEIVEPGFGPVPFIGIARHQRDTSYQFPGMSRGFPFENEDRLCVFWCNVPKGGTFGVTDVVYPVSQTFKPNPSWLEETFANYKSQDVLKPDEFADTMTSLAVNFVYLKNCRPEYVEEGHKLQRTLKSGVQVWSPNFIGRKYATDRRDDPTPLDKTGKVAILRHRCSHWTTQAYGPQYSLRKTIWIKDYIATHWVNIEPAPEAETRTECLSLG